MNAPASAQRLDLPIEGMTCASCANRIERNLNRLDGVQATVNYATERASVRFDAERVTPGELVAAVEAAGYAAQLPSSEAAPAPAEDPSRALRRRLAFAAVLSLPVLALAMIPAL
ncbi:MAG: P-type Cu+ transporter, partial [Gaiellales bacterium]|nr:P-type Cu+ transporter [Gaiellales bacterium]